MVGKFDSLRDSALHYLCSSGWGNESFGNVEAPTGYVSRISNSWEDVKPANKAFESVIEDWEDWDSHVEAHTTYGLLRSLVGHFLVVEDNQGFVSVTEYATETLLIQVFNSLEEIYNDWDSQDEEEN